MYNRRLGNAGENMACEILEIKGYMIIKRNYRCRSGEIDIIVRRGNEIGFVTCGGCRRKKEREDHENSRMLFEGDGKKGIPSSCSAFSCGGNRCRTYRKCFLKKEVCDADQSKNGDFDGDKRILCYC